MEPRDSKDVTRLLRAWGAGDQRALDELTPIVYAELKALARHYMKRERADHPLQTTALAHEAWIRLARAQDVDWKDRVHFFAVSAKLMRRILVDAARARAAGKRAGERNQVQHSAPLDLDQVPAAQLSDQVLALEDALEQLGGFDERKARVVELRFYGGLSVEETAEVLQVSPQTVLRDWKLARAWLIRELGPANTQQDR